MPAFPQGHALVIGVGAYADERLKVPTATRDAKDLAATLRDPQAAGYDERLVDTLVDADATRAGVLRGLQRIADRAARDSIVLISFTCHGAEGTDGLYYLATTDAGFTADQRIVGGTGLAVTDLARALRAIPAQRVLLLVNACFAGQLGPRLSAGDVAAEPPPPLFGAMLSDEAGNTLVRGDDGQGRAILAAARPDQRSYLAGDDRHSLFGQAAIEAFAGAGVLGKRGQIGLFELYEAVYVQVVGAARRLGKFQEPALTLLQGVGAFPVAAYQGRAGSEADLSQRPPAGAAVREVPPITLNITNKRSVISFDGATVMGDVRTGHVVEGDLTIIGGERAPAPEEEPEDPLRRLPLLRARIEVARNVDVGDRDEAAAQLRLAEGSLARGDVVRARRQIETALTILRAMNNAYVNSAVRKLEALAQAL